MFVNLKISCLITGGWREDNAANFHIEIQKQRKSPEIKASVGDRLSGDSNQFLLDWLAQQECSVEHILASSRGERQPVF
jgi:hypothetical protein